MNGRFVSYLRVSTDSQGERGLGMEAQRRIVADYLNGGSWSLIAEYVEVESGKNVNRAQLAAALAHAKRTGSTLLIAKLDRLARNVCFISSLMETKVPFVACDMPHAKPFELHIRASLAEEEARLISERTRQALAVAKARGVKLGGFRGFKVDPATGLQYRQKAADALAASTAAIVREMLANGRSLRQIGAAMDAMNISTARGGKWTAESVSSLIKRMDRLVSVGGQVAPVS
jgi:DNA invertase Pin-like site-specific DNA recombinase